MLPFIEKAKTLFKSKFIHDTSSLPIQPVETGVGPLYNRQYSIIITNPQVSPIQVMKSFQSNPNNFVNNSLIRFDKTKGEENFLKIGDEFLVHMTAPWNAPSRVSQVEENFFKLQTLEGNMEAGEIIFTVDRIRENTWQFSIESIAKSKDLVVDLVYDKIKIAKIFQQEIWKYTCEYFAKTCLPTAKSEVSVITKKRVHPEREWEYE